MTLFQHILLLPIVLPIVLPCYSLVDPIESSSIQLTTIESSTIQWVICNQLTTIESVEFITGNPVGRVGSVWQLFTEAQLGGSTEWRKHRVAEAQTGSWTGPA